MIHEMTVAPKISEDSDECDANSAPGSVAKPHGMELRPGETLRRTSLGGFFWGRKSVFGHLIILHGHSLILIYPLCLQRTLL